MNKYIIFIFLVSFLVSFLFFTLGRNVVKNEPNVVKKVVKKTVKVPGPALVAPIPKPVADLTQAINKLPANLRAPYSQRLGELLKNKSPSPEMLSRLSLDVEVATRNTTNDPLLTPAYSALSRAEAALHAKKLDKRLADSIYMKVNALKHGLTSYLSNKSVKNDEAAAVFLKKIDQQTTLLNQLLK